MKIAPKPLNELERLNALREYQILDTSPEQAFDRLTELAATLLGTEIALVSLVDEARQWFKSRYGIDATETPRELAFCAHAILDDEPLVVPDATADERFHDNPLVASTPHIRFYAGAPLKTRAGFNLGTLCVIDRQTRRHLDASERKVLADLAAIVVSELELRKASRDLRSEVEARQAAQEILERQAAELARSNEYLRNIASMMSHDLQEPLRMVASYTQLLQKRYAENLDEDGREFVAYAHDGAVRMQALINDLLDFSRASMGPLELATVESRAALEGALANLRDGVEKSGATVNYGGLASVRANGRQLQQLFQNLIGNALKYRSDAPPVVDISATREGGDWHFTIADNGIGIAPEHRERVFEMFKRLHTRAEIPGTGIGLALCRSIVERHGGRIWVESAPGEGSRFHFTIPSA